MLGELGPVDPLEALDRCAALAHARLASLARLGARHAAALAVEGQAFDRLLRAAKAAADVDLAERHAWWLQRTASVIARAFDAALADEDLGDARRAALVRRFHDRLEEAEHRAPSLTP